MLYDTKSLLPLDTQGYELMSVIVRCYIIQIALASGHAGLRVSECASKMLYDTNRSCHWVRRVTS